VEGEFLRLVYRGAEADIFSGQWAGEKAIFKFRKPLPYRHPLLDIEIRAQRTVHEAVILHDAKSAGVNTPYLYFVSQPESLIVMQEIEGPRLKSLLGTPEADGESVSVQFGVAVGRLHRGGIMHGDLTTSNVLVDREGVRLIDFGLSTHSVKVEDHAVDLRLIKETLSGAHSEVAVTVMASFMKGYAGEVGDARARAVGRKLLEIERRGRYARLE
jgi:TP53 regulating kinase and related kinases